MRDLLKKFEARLDLPIEIDEIHQAIIELGYQDRIVLCDEDLDTEIIRGAFYQYREHGDVYGEARWTTLVVYPRHADPSLQRLVCAKEMVHIFDEQISKTQTPEMVSQLAVKVLGKPNGNPESAADLIATLDNLAVYVGINLLFPREARKEARLKVSAGELTVQDVAEWAVLPIDSVTMALDEGWEEIAAILERVVNGNHA